MNPFSQHLVAQLHDAPLAEFVSHWDRLEDLVIRIYKGRAAAPGDALEHDRLRAWLLKAYPHWQAALDPYWPLALAAGRPPAGDPFAFLMSFEQAGDFIRNRAAITTLPAARQALNQYLLDRLQPSAG